MSNKAGSLATQLGNHPDADVILMIPQAWPVTAALYIGPGEETTDQNEPDPDHPNGVYMLALDLPL